MTVTRLPTHLGEYGLHMSDDDMGPKIDDVLQSDDPLLESCRRYLATLSPVVDAICSEFEMTALTRELVLRCIVKRTQENFGAVVEAASGNYSYMTPLALRPLCEDLIYGCWLRTLPGVEADQFISLSTYSDIAKSVEVQSRFLPRMYSEFSTDEGDGAEGTVNGTTEAAQWESSVSSAGPEINRQLRTLGARLGWPGGRVPSTSAMARQCGLTEIYDFFYHGTSKSVHSNLHHMLRMAWGNPGGKFRISSKVLAPHYRTFSLAYGAYLTEELFTRIVEPQFPDECSLIDDKARSIWIAGVVMILVHNRALPQLVTKEELMWPRS